MMIKTILLVATLYVAAAKKDEGCNCPAVWDPVCGEDGQTYGNACEAGCAGVSNFTHHDYISIGGINSPRGTAHYFFIVLGEMV